MLLAGGYDLLKLLDLPRVRIGNFRPCACRSGRPRHIASGARTGVRRMRRPSLANTPSNMAVNLLSRSRIKKRELSCAVAEADQEVAGLLGHPGAAGVCGESEEVDAAGRVLHHSTCSR